MDNREELGIAPPNSTEAEISVLGAMLQDSGAVLRASDQLTPDDFYQPEHREIFRVMTEMNRAHTPIDIVTLQAELARRGTLDGVGGVAYLMKLYQDVPTAVNVKAYKAIVIIVIVVAGSPVVKAKLSMLWNRLRSGGTSGIKEVG